MLSVPIVIPAGVPVPLWPLFASLVVLGICLQKLLKPCFGVCFLAGRPSHLHDPSSKYLSSWVKIALALGDGAEKLVGSVVVVSVLEDIDDGCSPPPDFLWGGTGGFNHVHGTCIDFGKDDLGFRFGACGAVSQPSELVFSFVSPLVEGAAACGLPGRKVSSQISEVCNDFDATVDVLPERALEPSSDLVGPGEIIAFARCYLHRLSRVLPLVACLVVR